MGRNQKKLNQPNQPPNSHIPKHNQKTKPVQKQSKEKQAASPQRKQSRPAMETKVDTSVAIRSRNQLARNRPVDAAKMNEVKDGLVELEQLINTYDEVEMDKQCNLKKLVEYIEFKYNKIIESAKPE